MFVHKMSGPVGLRVVRGPHWQGQSEDGGEGGLGTVVCVLYPTNAVTVRWDNGILGNYRAAEYWACDLRIFDSAACGIRHASVWCDACNEKAIFGIRWRCAFCYDYDLCTTCYMADKHDLAHPFLRISEPSYAPVAVPPRQSSPKIYVKGIGPGAVVSRGHDWKWEDQDGGPSFTGVVTEVSNWPGNGKRNAVRVLWRVSRCTGLYRLGYKGRVDLVAITYNQAQTYYPDHLPNLDVNRKLQKLRGNPDTAYALAAASVRECTLREQHRLRVSVADSSAERRGGTCSVNTDVNAAISGTEQCAFNNALPRVAQPTQQNDTQFTQAPCRSQSLDTELDSSTTGYIKELERLRQLELQVMCPICNERRRDTAFDCGHTVCNECSTKIKTCAECRKPIRSRLLLFM